MPAPSPAQSDSEDDVELMSRVAKGDEEAFAAIVSRHQYAVVGTVSKMLGGSTDAEDIAQQVFIRLWKSAKKYKPTAKFTTYLFTITRNLVFNESRRRKRKQHSSIEEQGEEWGAQVVDNDAASPSDEALKAELVKAVDKAIGNLPEKQRMAVILRRYENMPYEEIAKVLGISVSAVKSQLFRARSELKESLASYLSV